MNLNIIGTGSAVPSLVVNNDELGKFIDTNNDWIVSRTGIEQRRLCGQERISDLAVLAAKRALENAKTDAEDLDLIICSTVHGDYFSPSLASIIQGGIGANCVSYDINAACSGFVYALDIANTYYMAQRIKKVLIVSAEAISKLLDWHDRATCVLFGDGAGAVVLSEGNSLLGIRLRTEGQINNLYISGLNSNNYFFNDGQSNPFVRMNGKEIYKFAISAVKADVDFLINEIGISVNDIDYFILHQANKRIIEAVRTRLEQPDEKFPTNIERYGNTSSASIPILLDELNKSNMLTNKIIFLSAFGAGLTSGACIFKWNQIQTG